MNRHVTTGILFTILLVVVLWAAFRVIAPFLGGLTWAALLVAAFRPWHRRLERLFGARWAATTVVTGLVALFVVVPLVVAAVHAVQGGLAAVRWIDANYQGGGSAFFGLADRWPTLAATAERAKTLVGLADVDVRAKAISWLATLGSFLVEQGPALVGGAFGLAFSFGVMLLAMPALFSNGERFSAALADALPIPTADATRILDDLAAMARSLVMSTGVTAAAQAALGGVALLALGVPYAGSLTAVMFFCTLVPGGTALVWGPAAIWLAAEGHPWKAVLLVAWGGGVVSTIDNLLRPLLAGKDVKLSGGLLFVGMLGGMAAFGLVGLFLGPIALYLSRELVRILRRDIYDTLPVGPALAAAGVIGDTPAPQA
jgi:predicted PurR-regulated permease PerM